MKYIIIRGPLGIGKSTIAKGLANKLNAKYISIDSIVDNPNLITRKMEEGYISQNNFLKANKLAIKESEDENLIVLDGNFYWKSVIKDIENKLKEGFIFTLKAPLEICMERNNHREKPYSEIAVKEVYKKSTEFDYGKVINTENKTAEEVIEEIMNELK